MTDLNILCPIGSFIGVYDLTVEAMTEDRIEEVYRAEARRLRSSLLAFTGDLAIANDAVAEAFAQCVARGEAIRDPARWVWKVAFRISRAEMQRRSKHGDMPAGLVAESGFELAEQSAELLAALAKLPIRQRAALVLYYLADMPAAEVAKHLGVTQTTVRVHLNHGRTRLRSLMEDRDG